MYIYETGPIDFGWLHINTLGCLARDYFPDVPMLEYNPYCTVTRMRQVLPYMDIKNDEFFMYHVEEYLEFAESALVPLVLCKSKWEGDCRSLDYVGVCYMPAETAMVPAAFIVKQDNNGTTFVCSKFELNYEGYKLIHRHRGKEYRIVP